MADDTVELNDRGLLPETTVKATSDSAISPASISPSENFGSPNPATETEIPQPETTVKTSAENAMSLATVSTRENIDSPTMETESSQHETIKMTDENAISPATVSPSENIESPTPATEDPHPETIKMTDENAISPTTVSPSENIESPTPATEDPQPKTIEMTDENAISPATVSPAVSPPIMISEFDAVPVSDEDEPAIQQGAEHETSVPEQSNIITPSEPEQQEVLDDLRVAREMNQYIHVNRINLAELSTVGDIWPICDAISAAHSGLPDSLLKMAFLLALEGQYQRIKNNHWMRQHLDMLIRTWKREVNSDKPSSRPTKFISATREYSPPPEAFVQPKRKKVKKERKRALQTMMGVGTLLKQARVKFATEEGELDVEEDDYGIFSIGGNELSFENWGELNKIRDDGIVHVSLPAAKRRRIRQMQSNGRMRGNGGKPMTPPSVVSVPTSVRSSVPTFDEPTERYQPPEKLENPATPKPEKDEGEISESDQSSSTTSSSNEEGGSRARIRRTKRRQAERIQGGTSSVQNLSSIFQKCYEFRFKIAHRLSLQQKAQFLEILKQNKGASAGQKQQQQMTSQFMGSFMAFLQNRPSEGK